MTTDSLPMKTRDYNDEIASEVLDYIHVLNIKDIQSTKSQSFNQSYSLSSNN